jgi:hypothetical protein
MVGWSSWVLLFFIFYSKLVKRKASTPARAVFHLYMRMHACEPPIIYSCVSLRIKNPCERTPVARGARAVTSSNTRTVGRAHVLSKISNDSCESFAHRDVLAVDPRGFAIIGSNSMELINHMSARALLSRELMTAAADGASIIDHHVASYSCMSRFYVSK